MPGRKPVSPISPKPLRHKLGWQPGMKAFILNPPDQYAAWIGEKSLPGQIAPPYDFVHLFSNSITELEKELFQMRQKLKTNGMLWVSWYKKNAGLPTEVNEQLIRDTCFPLGLVDVKVCAIDDQWSALKLVIRKELR